ncbi:glycoside hydrolase family 113 [Maribacter sp. LLG6340-A2]|uniref:glycoside hydrolase family 113 n=1 Tax=Maribacter sp. LLG6340-A2 TaxID=3160834 RepID=UPI003864F5E3
MKRKHLVLTLIVALLAVGMASVQLMSGADNNGSGAVMDSVPTKRELRRNFFDKRKILVVYAANDSLLAQRYKELLNPLSQKEITQSWRSTKVDYKNASTVSEQELEDNVVFLVGAIDEHNVLQRYLSKTPFRVAKEKINIGPKQIENANPLLSVGFYPSPFNPQLPFSFLTGTDAIQIFDFFAERVTKNGQGFYRQNLDYEVYDRSKRLVLGNFDAQYKIDTSTYFDFSQGDDLILDTDRYKFIAHQNAVGKKGVQQILKRLERVVPTIHDDISSEVAPSKITYHFYRSMEEKGLMTGNTNQSHIDTVENAVHTIVNEVYKDNHTGKDYALILHQKLGSSNKDILTVGLPIYFTTSWQKKGYEYWAERLISSNNVLTASQLLNNELMQQESSLIRECLAGLFTKFLMETWGTEKYLSAYRNFDLGPVDMKLLEKKWQGYLKDFSKEHPKEKNKDRELPYLKGFNFAHEGYNIYNGYGSGKATESLLKQKNMGSNAVAIVPYSGTHDIHKPTVFHFSDHAGGENDESVVHAATMAHEMGMYTVLKPQIYVRGSWPGGIEMKTDADWEQFFDHYYRWIRHYAFLAEIYDIDALCIGVEFTKATLNHPDAWRKMIERTRGLYSGQLTYAANWGEEFENIAFWDDLDFIGLNSYYPLSKKDNPTDTEMVAKFDTIKTKIKTVYEQFKKPIVFTEIGFRSIDTPWKNPHAEADESINQEMQQRCYEIIFKGIENEPWCQGILWWKYPSYLEYRGVDNNAFTPNNKLADETVRKWFTK